MNYKSITRSESNIEKIARWFWLIVACIFVFTWIYTGNWLDGFYYALALPIGSLDLIIGTAVIILTILNLIIIIKKKLF